MILSFELTMPNRGSWNGQWSGQDRKYFVIRKTSKNWIAKQEHLKTLLAKGRDYFYYRWEDGWGANVCVEVVDASEARKRRKASAGFCGYEWMINSIMYHGEIQTDTYWKENAKSAAELTT
jgi:hypothetical protein